MGRKEPEWLRQLRAAEKGAEIMFGESEAARLKEFVGKTIADYGARLIEALRSSASAPRPETPTPDPNDPYAILDIPPNSPDWLLRLAYRDRAKKAHPDAGGSDEEMKRVNAAYEKIKEERGGQPA